MSDINKFALTCRLSADLIYYKLVVVIYLRIFNLPAVFWKVID